MFWRVTVLASVLLAGAAYVEHAARAEELRHLPRLASLPLGIGEWHGRDKPFPTAVVKVLGVDDYINRIYSNTGPTAVSLYVGYYRSQRQGDAIHSPMNCMPGAGWEPEAHRRTAVSVRTSAGLTRGIVVNQYIVRKGADRQLLLYWYQGRGRVVANEYASRFYMVLDAMRKNRTDAALVRVLTPIADDQPLAEPAAAARAGAFVEAMFPHLSALLPS